MVEEFARLGRLKQLQFRSPLLKELSQGILSYFDHIQNYL